jgi:hypothetical protein
MYQVAFAVEDFRRLVPLGSERRLELLLRLHPSLHSGPETGFASPLFAPAIAAALFVSDQAVALERQDVRTERGSVITISAARASIVIGPNRHSFARIENCVVRSPLGVRK